MKKQIVSREKSSLDNTPRRAEAERTSNEVKLRARRHRGERGRGDRQKTCSDFPQARSRKTAGRKRKGLRKGRGEKQEKPHTGA